MVHLKSIIIDCVATRFGDAQPMKCDNPTYIIIIKENIQELATASMVQFRSNCGRTTGSNPLSGFEHYYFLHITYIKA